ncbi:MAG: hypothetical protein LBJ59_01855 [Zoogloeaceae bacterium]|jgi:hypothetical protein|nr:hypothetical protein [Zoogloeaceae bacterium]
MQKTTLTTELLCKEAQTFSEIVSNSPEPSLFGITDGKAVGTHLEHKFRLYLQERYTFTEGNSANGIDFPSLGVDMKVTSIRQPQSSCPFKSARQKIYGLGYGLIVFVYDKTDDDSSKTAILRVMNTVFVDSSRTADFQTTSGLRKILENEGNIDDLVAFMADKNLPVDDIGLGNLAKEIMTNKPEQGYLTISNALQWRLQYGRIIEKAGKEPGICSVYKGKNP